MEAGREKTCNKKGKTKNEVNKRPYERPRWEGIFDSAGAAEAGKEGFRAAGLVRPELFSTPSPS